MAKSPVRVLIVDDFEAFRRFIVSMLQEQPALQVIGEVSDGVEAVQKADELQPELILLDLGLPKLNGIEAAQQIRELSPKSKILVLSQEPSASVVQRALSVGARGYVVKADAGTELLAAVDTVVRGERFVGRRFAGHNFADASDSQVSDGRGKPLVSPAPIVPRKAENTHRHEAHFYPDDASLLDGFTQFVATALRSGNTAIVIAPELHRNGLVSRLQAHGLDIDGAMQRGRYLGSDAADMVRTFMANGLPDPARFSKVVGDLLTAAARAGGTHHTRIAVCGECAPLLCIQDKPEAAIRLEQLWDEIARSYDVDILCGYQTGSFHGEQGGNLFRRICAEHSAVHSL